MRKLGFGFLWFSGFYMGIIILGSAVLGGVAGSHAGRSTASVAENYQAGHDAGGVAGRQFVEKYNGIIFVTSMVIAIVGAATGILPGTKKDIKDI